MKQQTEEIDLGANPLGQEALSAVTDAIQSLDLALVLWDEDLNFVFANQLWYEIMFPNGAGVPPKPGDPVVGMIDDMLNTGFDELPTGMTQEEYQARLIAILKSYAKDVQVKLRDGKVLNASVFKTGLGGYLISYRDITEEIRSREEAEAQRAKTERANTRLRDALESIGEGFALFDGKDRLILANDLYKRANPAASHLMTFGRPRDEIIEAMATGGDILGVDDWVDSYERESRDGDTSSPRRYEVHHADGRVFLASRGRTAEGGCTITWLDITDGKKTEARARAIVNDAMEALDEGFALFDAELRFVFCNQMYAQIVLGGPEFIPELGQSFASSLSDLHDRQIFALAQEVSPEQHLKRFSDLAKSYAKAREFERTDGGIIELSSHETGLGGYLITARDVTAVRIAEQTRREADELVRAIVDAAPTTFMVSRVDTGELIYCPPQIWARMKGVRSTSQFFLSEEDRSTYIQALLDAGYLNDYPVTLRDLEGVVFQALSSARLIEYKGEQLVVSSTRDITEQLAMEEERRQAEKRELAAVTASIEALTLGVALYDANFNFVMGNKRFFEIWYKNGDIQPIQPGENNARAMGRFLDRGYFEYPEGVNKTGYLEQLWHAARTYKQDQIMEGRLGVIRWSSHKTDLGGYLLEFEDVTEQVQAEEERRQSEARALAKLTDTVQALDIGLILLDADLNFVFCNQRFLDFYHQSLDPPMAGESMHALTHRLVEHHRPVDSPFALEIHVDARMAMIRDCASGHEAHTREGRVLLANVHRTPEDGRLIAFTDITDQRKAEAELAHQREVAHQNEKLSAMGELLAGVAHELNNPLSIVVGYALMMQNSVTEPKLRRQIDNIAQAADRCSRIVKAFLAMARQRPTELVRCSVNELLLTAVDIVGHRLRASGVEIEMDLDESVPDIEADEDQIIQVFTNLLVNAEQALADQEGDLRLKLRSRIDSRASEAIVTIADNGPGIDQEILSRIFEPFYTTKDVGTGTGIGLAFSHRIVDTHGGRIEVSSEKGKGAKFSVHLSLHEGDEAPEAQEEGLAPSTFGRILVVDDETGVAEMIGDILGDADYQVQITHDARLALEL
ncbi:MAG: PAS-domain containing protein, partial [Pseudomonadota bacterium]